MEYAAISIYCAMLGSDYWIDQASKAAASYNSNVSQEEVLCHWAIEQAKMLQTDIRAAIEITVEEVE